MLLVRGVGYSTWYVHSGYWDVFFELCSCRTGGGDAFCRVEKSSVRHECSAVHRQGGETTAWLDGADEAGEEKDDDEAAEEGKVGDGDHEMRETEGQD